MKNKNFVDEVFGTYKGHDYVVRFHRMGHRCGYVRVNEKSLFDKIKKTYDELFDPDNKYNIECHGGLTFVEEFDKPDHGFTKVGCWIGFDCNHCDDLQDIHTALKLFPESSDKKVLYWIDNHRIHADTNAAVRSSDYVESECKGIIAQLCELSALEDKKDVK